ncbi:DMT family transporter [Brevibacillus centrosporus]|uniref:DMT family transporter n=1 Tax=Brevibacillus centrosporus TaxID=54910 RepID=UPI002E1BA3EE|nr:EamA family transporter [Brevibacillus centrosporus]MED1949618.1 EamA family transporter [Brevibacillus centrosporus]
MIRSYLLVLMCVIFWGSDFVFGSILVREFPPLLLSGTRLLFIVLFLVLYALWHKQKFNIARRDLTLFLFLGMIGMGLNQWSFYKGLETTDPATASLILALAPITTVFLAALFLKEKMTVRLVIGAVIAISGVFLIITNGNELEISEGAYYILITMLTFSLSIVCVRKLVQSYDFIAVTVYQNLIGFMCLSPVALGTESVGQMSTEVWAWFLLIATGIVIQGVSTLVWNSQLQKVGAARAAMFLNLEPFVAMILGFALLGHVVSHLQLMGSFLIIAGVIVTTAKVSPKLSEKQKLSFRK